MKKLNLLLAVCILLFSCKGSGNNKTTSAGKESSGTKKDSEIELKTQSRTQINDYKGAEVAFVKDSTLYFYYPENGKTKKLTEETEPVFNCVFDNTTEMIYYTVIKGGELWLKKACYQKDNPVEITEILNFGVKPGSCVSETYGEKSLLLFNRAEEVVLVHDFFWDMFSFEKMTAYSTAMGGNNKTSRNCDYHQINDFWGFVQDKGFPHSVNSNNLIYKNNNLTDALDIKFDPDNGLDNMEYTNFKLSPDKSKLMFMAIVAMGDMAHGPLCIANVDGSNQHILKKDGMGSEYKAFWINNMAVFMRNVCLNEDKGEYQNQLCITNPADNKVSVIAKDIDYFTAKN